MQEQEFKYQYSLKSLIAITFIIFAIHPAYTQALSNPGIGENSAPMDIFGNEGIQLGEHDGRKIEDGIKIPTLPMPGRAAPVQDAVIKSFAERSEITNLDPDAVEEANKNAASENGQEHPNEL